jgi:hypothetical protein
MILLARYSGYIGKAAELIWRFVHRLPWLRENSRWQPFCLANSHNSRETGFSECGKLPYDAVDYISKTWLFGTRPKALV